MKHIKLFEQFINERKSFKSLKDIELALRHLMPNAKIEKGSSFYNLDLGSDGYIEVNIPKYKNDLVFTYRKSEWSDGNVGVMWLDGDKNKGHEFSSDIESLHNLLKELNIL